MLLILCLLALAGQPFEDRTFPSRVFGQTRSYRLFLPAGYAESGQRYPVIYYFHGHSDRYTLERYDDGKDTVPKIARFVAENPVIVVAVDGYVPEHYQGFYGGAPYDVMADGGKYDFGAYFQEMVAHIDASLRTLPTRRYRGTSGLSMGGFASLYLSARYPELVGSASAFNPGHEFFVGEKGRRSLWRLKDHVQNHASTMVRLVRASGDYISQYHEELRAAYAAAPQVDFEFRQDEYHRHWATSIGETFAFHRRAFANPALDVTPEEWSYTNAHREFEVRGYRVTADTEAPALVTLRDVRQGGFVVSTRRWAPDGPPAPCASLRVMTAPVYRAGERYRIVDRGVTGEAVADAEGRLTVNTNCAGHYISFVGPGTGAQPPVMLPWTERDAWRVRPGETLEAPVRLYNPRGTALENVRAELSSEYPTVEILTPAAKVDRLEPGAVADLGRAFRVRFTAGAGDFARIRLRLKLTYDGYLTRTENIDVYVAPDRLQPPAEVAVLDGRTRTFRCFRQKGNQGGGFTVERTVTEGKGNGNGILEPGEEATFWVRLKQGLDPFDKDNWHRAKVYSDSPLLVEVADIQEEKQREWTSSRNRTSVMKLSTDAGGREIRLILDRESWSFHFTPDVRYGTEPLYQAYQLHQHHLFDWILKAQAAAPADDAAGRAARELAAFRSARKIAQELRVRLKQDAPANGFRVRAGDSEIAVEARTGLGLYQGAFFLEDLLREQTRLAAGFERAVEYPFADRYLLWDVLLNGQNKGALGFDLERHLREAVRLGYTGIEVNHFVGMTLVQQNHPRDPYPWYTYWGPSMDQFVSSPLFDGAFDKEYLQRNLAALRRTAALARSYGLKPVFVGYEPRYVPEAFFARHPELRGPRVDHPLRSMQPRYSLCTDREEVRAHYRTLARSLAEAVPELAEMHVIFLDSGAGLCWANGLYPGRNGPAHCQRIPAGERLGKFFSAIQQGFRDAGRDIKLVAQPHGGNRTEFDAFFDSAPKSIDFTAGSWASWSLTYRDPLDIDRHVLARQRDTGRRGLYYQQHFLGFDGAPTGEFPAPFHLAERLQRALAMKLDALNTLGGFAPPPIKERSAMQEVYRRFVLEPSLAPGPLVAQVARDLGGEDGGRVLVAAWTRVRDFLRQNRQKIGFALGTEYAARRTLVRPLVPDTPALLDDERDWWQAFTFGGDLRYGHAHLFLNELFTNPGGAPSAGWYEANRDHSRQAAAVMRAGSAALRDHLRAQPRAAERWPYLLAHERQFRFLAHVYETGANLYEGQRILDRYGKKAIEEDLKPQVESDAAKFERAVRDEIANTEALLDFLQEGGETGMIVLPQETTWAYGPNFAELLRKKIDTMKRHLPETRAVLNRWFASN